VISSLFSVVEGKEKNLRRQRNIPLSIKKKETHWPKVPCASPTKGKKKTSGGWLAAPCSRPGPWEQFVFSNARCCSQVEELYCVGAFSFINVGRILLPLQSSFLPLFLFLHREVVEVLAQAKIVPFFGKSMPLILPHSCLWRYRHYRHHPSVLAYTRK